MQKPFDSIKYRGRFAPSPTGPLHFGSLVAAVGSYLDAKHHHGKWLVRIEDLDTPRTVKGADHEILGTLEAFGLHWDEDIVYQSQRTAAYETAFQQLKKTGVLYPCCCTRKEIADSALHGIDGQIYPGTCRNGIPAGREGRAWRVRTNLPSPLAVTSDLADVFGQPSRMASSSTREGLGERGSFNDALQGRITQRLESEIGDFVVLRADGLFAYQLAVVVDDAAQEITGVVRGADLLCSTPRQMYLQQLLGFVTPSYMHLPVAVNAQGEKLSKQTLAKRVETIHPVSTLFDALVFLRQHPPVELQHGTIEGMLAWAIANWQPESLLNCRQITIE